MSNVSVSAGELMKKLFEENPKFHGKGEGDVGSHNWAIQPPVLEWMIQNIRAGSCTLETGCGYTSVILAAIAKKHTVISPSPVEHDRIRKWCQAHGIETQHVNFIANISQDVLPGLSSEPLDFVLVDGDHAFPGPFIDWYYTADKVQVGGFLAVDDTQITTGKILRDFLSQESMRWNLVTEIGKTAIFKRTGQASVIRGIDWMKQPFCAPPPEKLWVRIVNKIKRETNKLVQGSNGSKKNS